MTATDRKMNAPTASSQRGLTMMELLVTVVILSLLMAGLSQLVVTNSQNANATGALARIADTGRAAIQLLSADIRRAGYLGGNISLLSSTNMISGTQATPTYAINCVADTTDWALMLNQPIVGINAPDDASEIAYDCIADADGDGVKWLQGDALTVRYTPTPDIDVGDMLATRPYLRVTMTDGKLFLGSEVNNSENEINDRSARDYNLAAHTYFVASTDRTCGGIEIPALFRKTINDSGLPESQELLAGVENLQFRYLVDNRYYDADDVPLLATGEWPRVDAVEITVLVRAECPETGFDINRTFTLADVEYTPGDVEFRRQVFTTTTQLRN
ncbi:MAG: PilW family protein [Halioglobus sp.]|nr:PilW family protein [Halioglobus sp.]